ALVGLARADQSVVRPDGAAPLPLLDDIRVGVLDQAAEPAEHLASPVAELHDPSVDQVRSRLAFLRSAFLHGHFGLPRLCEVKFTPAPWRFYLLPEGRAFLITAKE